MNAPLVYVVVVNYRFQSETLSCLEDLRRQTYPNYRVVLVENGSEDDTAAVVAERFPEVEVVALHPNCGSTGGFNAGLQHAVQAGAEYALIFNNDARLAPDGIERLVQTSAPDDVGAVGPLTFYYDAPEVIWSAGGGRSRWTLDLTGNHGRGQQFNQVTEREFLTTCILLVKSSVLRQVGLLDETYFIYNEDNDLSLRMRRAGYRLLLDPHTHAWHKVSVTMGGSESPGERYWMARNSVLFYRKFAHPLQWLLIVPWRLGSALRTSLRLLRLGKRDSLAAYWRGLRDGLRAERRG